MLRLHARFAGVEVEVVRRVLEDSYDQLLARATVTSFLVILAERTAATRLAAGQRSSTTALASTIALPSTTTTM